ncbi:hypothetical protein [Bradyrhizobium iriomotense]|uniref:hypothetical protein n=1 Tax=Bradyrhizobium iriomotense TaxID=441950 RepID=UPI0024E0C893|nr:hypothetical protein [Bradyrhizobium iriomotense]
MIERGAQRQHLAAHQCVAAPSRRRLGPRLSASPAERHTDLAVGTPDHAACQQLVVRKLQLELVRHAKARLELERCPFLGHASHHAIERRLPKIEDDLPGQERSFRRQTGHRNLLDETGSSLPQCPLRRDNADRDFAGRLTIC